MVTEPTPALHMRFFELTSSNGNTAHVPVDQFLRIETFDDYQAGNGVVQVLFRNADEEILISCRSTPQEGGKRALPHVFKVSFPKGVMIRFWSSQIWCPMWPVLSSKPAYRRYRNRHPYLRTLPGTKAYPTLSHFRFCIGRESDLTVKRCRPIPDYDANISVMNDSQLLEIRDEWCREMARQAMRDAKELRLGLPQLERRDWPGNRRQKWRMPWIWK
jgi:hypothetical protein